MNKRLVIFSFFIYSSVLCAERPVFTLLLENHLFYPAELIVPTNTKIKLIIQNKDSTPEQFDSFDLNREKVIFPNNHATVYIGPLEDGEYQFFGEYNPNSAVGKIIALESANVD